MIWTGWNNSSRGYGFTVDSEDFDKTWATVTVELPSQSGFVPVEANVAKKSFRGRCPHLIDKRIGRWMREAGYAPWPSRMPPKFKVEPAGKRRFRVKGLA
jgi:hypothetical protein